LHPNEDVMAYGSWSRGYKTGGWTTRLSNPLPFAPDFDEEKAETFEIGVKSTLLDRRLQINAAAFTTKYKGIQLNFQQGVSPVIQNAGDARIKGFEVELVAASFPAPRCRRRRNGSSTFRRATNSGSATAARLSRSPITPTPASSRTIPRAISCWCVRRPMSSTPACNIRNRTNDGT
jgi:iron complex outermembrane receptor protein